MDIPNYLLPTWATLRNAAGGYAYHQRIFQAPEGVTPAHIMNPDFWVHVAAGMPLNSRFEIVGDNFDMEVRVIGVDPSGKYLIMRCLRFCDSNGVAVPGMADSKNNPIPPDSDGYVIEETSGQGWRVLRGTDLLARNLPNKAAAIAKVAELKANKTKRVA